MSAERKIRTPRPNQAFVGAQKHNVGCDLMTPFDWKEARPSCVWRLEAEAPAWADSRNRIGAERSSWGCPADDRFGHKGVSTSLQ